MTETSEEVQTILFLNSLRSDEQFAAIFTKIGATLFFNPAQFEYLPLTCKAT